MSRGKRIEQAIELSEFVLKLSRGMKAHGKRMEQSPFSGIVHGKDSFISIARLDPP